jgi:hypothetical protein
MTDNRLGNTVAEKNKKLVDVLKGIAKIQFQDIEDNTIQKSVRKRTRLAHSICKIDYFEGNIEKPKTRVKYKKLDDGVKSNVKYAVRMYFRFLEQCK